ncbi:NAD(P)-binding protein [Hypoxylon sp. NC1633]|nr:NAD(P)-binding protein [Hypoxylon sp. NC1633]
MSTALIIGAGPNVGLACAEAFSKAGFKIALASRTQKLDPKYRHFAFDALDPDSVPALFEQVSSTLGVPSVVIYNALSHGSTRKDEPFERDLPFVHNSLNINVVSAYAAAHEAVKGFEKLGVSGLGPGGGTFIFTGNILNVSTIPGLMLFGMNKSASAHMIKHLALAVYHDKPYKFYYADERLADGIYIGRHLNGDAHADNYLELAKDPKQRDWNYTFVKGKGYVKFTVPDMLE